MKYCSKGNKGRVTYGFGGKSTGRAYNSDKCPIDLVVTDAAPFPTKSFSFNFGQNLKGASFNFRATPPSNIPKNWNAWIIYGIWDNYGSVGAISVPDKYPAFGYPDPIPGNCGNAWNINGTCIEHGYPENPTLASPTACSFTLEYRPPDSKPKSKITITDANGSKFEDTGDSPCGFSVQCGDCPPGQTRLEQPGYPGSCCCDCAALAKEVEAIAKSIS